jgi:hypothetical protein
MDHPIPIGLRGSVLIALCDAVDDPCFTEKAHEALCTAVTEWLERRRTTVEGAPQSQATTQPCAKAGYQWKQLFLPEGSELRVTLRGRVHHAAVEGNHIIYNGKPVSPSQIANAGDVVRNAWRVVWLKLPGEEWERAAHRRAPWRN